MVTAAVPLSAADAGEYVLRANDAAFNAARGYPSNFIRTAKYTLLTFLPLNLFEQFRRFS
jgi:hypothetical protein